MDWKFFNKKVNNLKEKYKIYEENNHIAEEELRELILDVLSWFEICIKEDTFINDTALVSAFRYINNKKKHAREIYKYNFTTQALFPGNNVFPSSQLYPSKFNVIWCNIDTETCEKRKGQWKNYQGVLANKNILETIDFLLDAMKRHYEIK